MKFLKEDKAMKYQQLLGIIMILLVIPFLSWGEELRPIKLITPQMDGGRLLMYVLKERKSSRDFSPKKLPLRVTSNLLWCANGINRPMTGKRTAPSANNRQEIDIYVARADGLFLYNANSHQLDPISSQDIRGLTGTQSFVAKAPLNLIYVADLSRASDTNTQGKEFYAALDTGFIGQNVYLYCASEGLVTVFRTSIDQEQLATAMHLRPDQKIIAAQTVGYSPK